MKRPRTLLVLFDTFLDAHPRVKSFFKGMASINIWSAPLPTYEKRFGTDAERLAKRFGTDAERLSSDWKKVGNDLHKALDAVRNQFPQGLECPECGEDPCRYHIVSESMHEIVVEVDCIECVVHKRPLSTVIFTKNKD